MINYFTIPGATPRNKISNPSVRIQYIIDTVCQFFNITENQIKAPCRKRRYAEPRQVAIYLSKKYTTMSLKDIASELGGRDHTTAIHSIQTVRDRMQVDETFRITLTNLETLFIVTPPSGRPF